GAAGVVAEQTINAPGVNFAAQNYAVADYLYQQADTFVKPKYLVTAQPLSDIEAPEVSTTFARLIPEQIGIRLSQLGYRMDLTSVTTTQDTNYLKPTLAPGEKPRFILTGNYLRKSNEVEVKTRIIDLQDNRIIAAFDYPIKMTREVREVLKSKPKIMRVEQ
ncbi:MAG: FlgO family outer membrane protein, partial [Bdellovibrionales bacterium]